MSEEIKRYYLWVEKYGGSQEMLEHKGQELPSQDLDASGEYLGFNHAPLYVLATNFETVISQLAALREELAKLKQVTNFSDAVACVFDFLKTTAANTGSREWDDQLEDLAEDVIEFAPEYKKQWQDICKLQHSLADAERRNEVLDSALREISIIAGEPVHSVYSSQDRILDITEAALNPNPEAASHDE